MNDKVLNETLNINQMKAFNFIFLFFLAITNFVFAQVSENELVDDSYIIREFFDSLLPSDTLSSADYSPNELLFKAAMFLRDTPYVGKTLELNKEEELVVNLRELDCMTFVENCLALSRAAQYPYPDEDYFMRQLKLIRYRGGLIQGYTSRLHYTSDWIYDNAAKGVIEDITKPIGGKRFKSDVHFMTNHPNLYSGLQGNRENIDAMIEIEKNINQRNTYSYIPKDEIDNYAPLIKNGDIICFTTSLEGLDISHLGIACWNKGQLTFIHASTKAKKVIVNPESVSDYCRMIKSNTGIMVLRPLKQVSLLNGEW